MFYTAYVYLCVCMCLSTVKMLDVSLPLKPRSTDIENFKRSDMSLSEVKTSLYKDRRDGRGVYPTKFQMIFSALYSPSLQFGNWMDMLKRHDDQSVFNKRIADHHTTQDLENPDANEVSNVLNAESHFGFKVSTGNIVEAEQATNLVADAEQERQRSQRNSTSTKGMKVNEYQKDMNAVTDEELVSKRQDKDCDISNATLNMLVEYFKHKTICGMKTLKVRFGLGK